MPSQTVCEFPAFRTVAASSSESFFVPASVVSIGDSPDFSKAFETTTVENESSDANPDGLGCARGLRSAFLLQGCMFLVGYGIWHLWHLAH